MDKMIYLITNSGSVQYIFEDKEERKKKLAELLEEEKHYHVTHYYYGTDEMTRGEYVCDKLCNRHECMERMAQSVTNSKDIQVWFPKWKELMRNMECSHCLLKEYSPFLKGEDK